MIVCARLGLMLRSCRSWMRCRPSYSSSPTS
jgi:hypothetical protein